MLRICFSEFGLCYVFLNVYYGNNIILFIVKCLVYNVELLFIMLVGILFVKCVNIYWLVILICILM